MTTCNTCTSWPLPPPADSPWDSFALATRPRSNLFTRAPVSRAPARASSPGASKPAVEILRGVACRFGIAYAPEIFGYPIGTQIILLPGSLDRSLRRIRDGLAEVPLLFGHDDRQLLTTSQHATMSLRVHGDELEFTLRGDTAAGRRAIRQARESTYRQMSLSLVDIKCLLRSPDSSLFVVSQATIKEVSLVTRAACEGCYAKFLTEKKEVRS